MIQNVFLTEAYGQKRWERAAELRKHSENSGENPDFISDIY